MSVSLEHHRTRREKEARQSWEKSHATPHGARSHLRVRSVRRVVTERQVPRGSKVGPNTLMVRGSCEQPVLLRVNEVNYVNQGSKPQGKNGHLHKSTLSSLRFWSSCDFKEHPFHSREHPRSYAQLDVTWVPGTGRLLGLF